MRVFRLLAVLAFGCVMAISISCSNQTTSSHQATRSSNQPIHKLPTYLYKLEQLQVCGLLEGYSIWLTKIIGGPSQFEVFLEHDGDWTRIKSRSDLEGKVQLSSAACALEFVRLFSSRAVYLSFGEEYVEIMQQNDPDVTKIGGDRFFGDLRKYPNGWFGTVDPQTAKALGLEVKAEKVGDVFMITRMLLTGLGKSVRAYTVTETVTPGGHFELTKRVPVSSPAVSELSIPPFLG